MTLTARDVNGTELRVGDRVRSVEWGDKAIHRTVEAIGTYEHIAGYVTVTGVLGWVKASRFEKCQGEE